MISFSRSCLQLPESSSLVVALNTQGFEGTVPELKSNKNPVLQCRARFSFALTQACPKDDYIFTRRNAPEEGAVFEFVVFRLIQFLFEVIS